MTVFEGMMSYGRNLTLSTLVAVSLLFGAAWGATSVARAESDFVVDPTFGTAAVIKGELGPISGSAAISPKLLTRDAEGRILFGAGSGDDWQIYRYLADGTPDVSFGDQGKVEITQWIGYTGPYAETNLASGVVKPDGRILLAGYIGSSILGNNARKGHANLVLKQLMPDGSEDLTFGQDDGTIWVEGGMGATKLLLRPDGGYLVGGFQQRDETGRTDDSALFIFNPDGSFDDKFQRGLMYSAVDVYGAPGRPSDVFDVDQLPGGRMLLSGTKKNYLWLMMLRKDGTRDPSFGKRGQVVMMPGGKKKTFVAVARDLEIDNQGRFLVTGFTNPKDLDNDPGYGLVMRFTRNGRPDKTFGTMGIVRLYGTPKKGESTTRLYDIQTDTQGGIWVVGSAGKSPRDERHAIAVRYTRNGKKDPHFFNKGVLNIGLGDGSVGTALIRAGKKMYLSGRYDQGDQENFFIKRLMPEQ